MDTIVLESEENGEAAKLAASVTSQVFLLPSIVLRLETVRRC